MSEANERRAKPRFSCDTKVWLDSGPVLRHVRMKNISQTGALVETLATLSVGDMARLRIEPHIEVDALIVWVEPGQAAGVHFETVLTPEPLTKFIHEREIDPACALAFSQTSTPTSKR